MACTTLTPASTTSTAILPVTGTSTAVTSLPFGVYSEAASELYSTDFISGAVDQVAYTYRKLGGDILDIELKVDNVYAAYEEAVLEYSYIVNVHQAKNVLPRVLGHTTGTFDHDGMLKEYDDSGHVLSASHVALKYPRFDYGMQRRVGDGISKEMPYAVGGNETEYSASFDIVRRQQDYDLQTIIASGSAAGGYDYDGLVTTKRVLIKQVFYKTPRAMWRFYGYYGGLNIIGNMNTYGQYADDSTWQIVPVWQNKAQAAAYHDALYTRISHYSYELKNNKLKLYPLPSEFSPLKMWVRFVIHQDAWAEDSDRTDGAEGINNLNTVPFSNLPFANINSMGKHWIRRYALAVTKEMLGQVRGKFGVIPIPNNSVTLNATELLAQADKERNELREELKTELNEMTYAKLAETDAKMSEDINKMQQHIPLAMFRG